MAKCVNVSVSLEEVGGNPVKLLRKFFKKCKKERIVEEYTERSRYSKPSVKRRRAAEKARRNAKKAERLRHEKAGII